MSTVTAVNSAARESAAEEEQGSADRCEVPHVACGAGQRAWREFLRAHACLAKRLDAELEQAHGLPMTSYEVLQHLEEASGGRLRMCELAEQAQLSRSGLTRLVDRLERDGLLERCSCEHDARGAYACLTSEGRERLQDARSTHLSVIQEQFFSHFTESELGSLAAMWERIAPCGSC